MNKFHSILNLKIDKKLRFIFIDFWDTIMHRTCHPEMIKKQVSEKIKNEYGLQLTTQQIYQLRVNLEKTLEKKSEEYRYSELCCLLYYSIQSSGKYKTITDDYKLFEEKMNDWEYNTEYSSLIVDKETVQWIKEQLIPVYIVSDFYLGKNVIKKFLDKFDIGQYIADIYVSCDYGCKKQTGRLFGLLLKQLKCTPDKVIMIGDNIYSDYKMPKKFGINAWHKRYQGKNKDDTLGNVGKWLLKQCKEICRNGKPLEAHVFNLYFFVEKLYQALAENNVNDVFFLAREGELLRLLFEKYQENHGKKKIKSHYICVSRVSTFLPSFRSINEEDFFIIFKQFKHISQEQFFSIIGLKEEMSDKGFGNWLSEEEIVDTAGFVERLREDLGVAKVYEDRRKQQRERFIRYIAQSGVDIYRDGMHIVDIGWKGTMQDNISNIYENRINISGYYFGLTEPGGFLPASFKQGLVFEKIPLESRDYDVWADNIILYERILMASHGSTLYYELEDGTVKPVYDNNPIDQENFQKFLSSRSQLIQTFDDLCHRLRKSYCSVFDLYETFYRCRLYSLYCKSKETVALERYFEKNVYENAGGKIFNYEKKTYWGYLKRVMRRIKHKEITFMQGIFIETLAYFCKIKGFPGCSAWFCRRYCSYLTKRRGDRLWAKRQEY